MKRLARLVRTMRVGEGWTARFSVPTRLMTQAVQTRLLQTAVRRVRHGGRCSSARTAAAPGGSSLPGRRTLTCPSVYAILGVERAAQVAWPPAGERNRSAVLARA